MFSGVRDAMIQNDSMHHTTIRIHPHLFSRVQRQGSPETSVIMVRDQKVPGFVTAVFCQFPFILLPSTVTTTGGQPE